MNTSMLLQLLKVALLAMATAKVDGKSNSNYYPSDLGMSDANIGKKMYWATALDILDDVSQFDALYVTHHNCA